MANLRILATEEMVGYGHATKTDTLNRHAMVEHEEDGTHGPITTTSITAPANSLVIKPTTDGTTAIQLADKDGNAILVVDTANNYVMVKGYRIQFSPAPGFLYGDVCFDSGDGSDIKALRIAGGGNVLTTRGAVLQLQGNEFNSGSNVGHAILSAGDNGHIELQNGSVLINATALIGSEKLRVNGDLYVDGNMSALTITDRTPFYEGDALAEICKIKGVDGKIDHASLPAFVKVLKVRNIYEDRIITRQRQKTAKVMGPGTPEIKLTDGKYVRTITARQEVEEPQYIEYDLYDEEGKQCFNAKDHTPIKHRVPEMEDYTAIETIKVGEEMVPERDLGALMSMFSTAIQQLTARVIALEAKNL